MGKQQTLEAARGNLHSVITFVNSELEQLGCSHKVRAQIDIAIDELFSNIASYAYSPDTGDVTVNVEVEENPLSVIITFLDGGTPFNPLTRKEPNISLSAEERPIGGLGIFMVKKMMDSVSYAFKDGKNILTILKYL